MPVQVLDPHVAELIAAGEVVERPASVIKELVENAIDAGSSSVTVEIQNGGISYMRITDDGCGIPHEEVPIAFLRHATSKVVTEDDLTRIGTLGFRGEALASIAAVARVDLLTATGQGSGTAYSIEGGREVSFEEAGCPKGTTIVVRDLFFNTPARMKFLKKDVSEGNAVALVMDRMALSHPEMAFRFIRDGKTVLSSSGKGGLEAAVYAVYGRDFSGGLMPVPGADGRYAVSGLISRPAMARKSRSMQHFFLNGRYVKSNTMMAALEQAYKGSIMVGRFPACVLALTMPSDEVDINVHPAKLECRFVNEKAVFDAVYYGVRRALQEGDTRPELTLPKAPPAASPRPQADTAPASPRPESRQTAFSPAAFSAGGTTPTAYPEVIPDVRSQGRPDVRPAFRRPSLDILVEDEPARPLRVASPALSYSAEPAPQGPVSAQPAPQGPASAQPASVVTEEPAEVPLRLIGEAFRTYVLVEHGEEILVIDKHAAHERILYENLKAHPSLSSQMLLEPVAVTLSKEEASVLTEHAGELETAGFELEDFGDGCVLVRGLPAPLSGEEPRALLEEVAAGFLAQKNAVEMDQLDWLYHNMACRAAVKGGDRSGDELLALARRIALSDDIRYCPHGRPVAFRLTRKELEKQFGRQG